MLFSATVLLLAAVSSVMTGPVVRPTFQQVSTPSSPEVVCEFTKPLSGCRLRVSEHYYKSFDSVLDFTLGAQSQNATLHLRVNASYAGAGLQRGQCGVRLEVEWQYHVMLVECHGQAEGGGGWSSGFGMVTATDYSILASTTPTPRLVVAVPGTDQAVLLKSTTGRTLTRCYIETPAEGEVDLRPGKLPLRGSRYTQHGAGAERGECGASLANVTQTDAGVWSWRGDQGVPTAWHTMVLLVQAAPEGDPHLEVQEASSLRFGTLMIATCVAPPGVPPANLTWLLGGQVIRRDDGNDTLSAEVGSSRPWHPRSVIQTITRRLTAQDIGQRLECRMAHSALPADRSVGQELTDATPAATPARLVEVTAEKPVVRTSVGYQSELACVVRAGPGTTVRWSRAGVALQQEELVTVGRDGQRHWLRLEETATEDLTEFTCTASDAEESASQVVQLTGLPGTPEWADPTTPSQLAWRVESTAPLTGCLLRMRQGKKPWQDFTDLDTSEVAEGWHLVTFERLPVPAGNYTAYLKARNEYGWSTRSQFQIVALDSPAGTTPPTPLAASGVPNVKGSPPGTGSCGLAAEGGTLGGGTVGGGTLGGGQEAGQGQFPWHAAVYVTWGDGPEPLCAATLVSRRHLLTAAHCVCQLNSAHALPASALLVTLGTTHRARANESAAQWLAVESVHVNSWYHGCGKFAANLAVLRLRDEVRESATVRRACVDWRNETEQTDLRDGRTAQMATWLDGSDLHWTAMTSVNATACRDKLSARGLGFRHAPDTLCAESAAKRAVCTHDAGAGLVFADAARRHWLRGVAGTPLSGITPGAGGACEHSDTLSGFTRISTHVAWLEAIVLAD